MGEQSAILLVVEDSDEDFEALQRTIRQTSIACQIQRCSEGDEALTFLFSRDSRETLFPLSAFPPSLILLDLNLPGMDGRDILARLKQDEVLKMIPVVVLSTSNNPKDIRGCYSLGANAYLIKPIDTVKFKRTVQLFVEHWFEAVTLPNVIDRA
ncbi:response regulator [Leptolyngbya sp. DQ-M1]|uniref:response regulator n=1 Tax=Leptolyngbya sp. DQ-M1 TaxID=2933920 RepID=UPI00329A20FD